MTEDILIIEADVKRNISVGEVKDLGLMEFSAWAKGAGHYVVVEAVERYMIIKGANNEN